MKDRLTIIKGFLKTLPDESVQCCVTSRTGICRAWGEIKLLTSKRI